MVVVLSKEEYIKEAECQLNDQTYYQKLTTNLTTQYAAENKTFVGSMATHGLIDKKTKEFMILYHPLEARFYLLPKIHKPGSPGRPTVSSSNAQWRTSHTLWTTFYNPACSNFPHIFGTPRILSTNFGDCEDCHLEAF